MRRNSGSSFSDLSINLFRSPKHGGGHNPGRRSSAMPVLQSSEFATTKTQQLLGICSDEWDRVQRVVISIFKGEKLHHGQLEEQINLIRVVLESDIRRFICEYYRKNLLKKCMAILVSGINESANVTLLDQIGDIWVEFYTETLPTLQAIFIPVRSQGLSIKQLTLLAFRDHVVLDRYETIKGIIEDSTVEVADDFKHMLLVLQGVREPNNEANSHQLETLISKIFYPHIGTYGVYTGQLKIYLGNPNKENDKMQETGLPQIKQTTNNATESTNLRARRVKSDLHRHGNTFTSSLSVSSLETLVEDRKRSSTETSSPILK